MAQPIFVLGKKPSEAGNVSAWAAQRALTSKASLDRQIREEHYFGHSGERIFVAENCFHAARF
jgi:hypothetical protein